MGSEIERERKSNALKDDEIRSEQGVARRSLLTRAGLALIGAATQPVVTFGLMETEAVANNVRPFGLMFSEEVAASDQTITRYATKTTHGGADVPNDESADTDN